jgi:predicted phosphodiesterase
VNHNIFVIGDVHGHWERFADIVESLPDDSHIIQLGDMGLGFVGFTFGRLEQTFEHILSRDNKILYLIHGNHDDYEAWDYKSKNPNIKLIKDFTELTIEGLNFYFIGGAVSIDRHLRTENIDYWLNEEIDFTKYIAPKNKIDVLITHSAPFHCYPAGFNDFCRHFFRFDRKLEPEMLKERQFLGEILKEINPRLHFYGHFHRSVNEKIGNCTHILLNELEIKQIIL